MGRLAARQNGVVGLFGRLFRHRAHRVDVGTYTPPKQRTLAPIESVVEEGVLISSHAVRLAIKNRLIVDALRDHADFDVEELKQVAHEHLLMLAAENDETAARLEQSGDDAPQSRPARASEELTVTETGDIVGRAKAIRLLDHRRRPQVHRRLADALRQRALEDDFLTEQVSQAQHAAWREVSRELVRRVREPQSFTPRDIGEYEKRRPERVRSFLAEDLAALAREHPPADTDSKGERPADTETATP